MGAGAVLAEADVVQAAVVADGDDAGGVDSVMADSVVRWDLVAGGEGFGAPWYWPTGRLTTQSSV